MYLFAYISQTASSSRARRHRAIRLYDPQRAIVYEGAKATSFLGEARDITLFRVDNAVVDEGIKDLVAVSTI